MQEITKAIDYYYEKAQQLWQIKGWNKPTFSLDLRGSTAGRAFYLPNHIKLNKKLYLENREEFCRSTVGHEISHLVVFKRFGFAVATDREHGEEWANIMDSFLLPPEPHHGYPVQKVRRPKLLFEYVCDCAAHYLSDKERRMKECGIRDFSCKNCKKDLTPLHK